MPDRGIRQRTCIFCDNKNFCKYFQIESVPALFDKEYYDEDEDAEADAYPYADFIIEDFPSSDD